MAHGQKQGESVGFICNNFSRYDVHIPYYACVFSSNNYRRRRSLKKHPTTDPAQEWKDKNKDAMRYAGDSAKKSIDAGLSEAPRFMKDADKGTNFEDVQTASVKWSLANDSNKPGMIKNAVMEVIGRLSDENKEPYLKNAEPLQKYIDTKDEYDYKNNNYTTTKNIDNTPDEKVREVQQKLNEEGYTDKFGEPLKEDGILGGKTLYAYDTYSKTNNRQPTQYEISTQKFRDSGGLTSRGGSVRTTSTTKATDTGYNPNYKVAAFPEPAQKKIQQGEDAIKRNKDNIINAGKKYGVNPAIIAACIYTEQSQNVNVIDTITDVPLYFIDTSIGVGQVKSSTAKMLEDSGYIEPLKQVGTTQDWHAQSFSTKPLWYIPGYGNYPGNEAEARACRLAVESENINYVAALLKYYQDRWSKYYKYIDGDTAILATLFNQNETKHPHTNPEPSPFGMTARNSYYHMRELLELD